MKAENLDYFEKFGITLPFGFVVVHDSQQSVYANENAYLLLGISNPLGNILPEEAMLDFISTIKNNHLLQIGSHYIKILSHSVMLNDESFHLSFLMDASSEIHNENKLYLYESAFNTMPNYAIVVCDKDGIILLYNELSSFYDGIPKDHVIGKHISSITKDFENDPLVKTLQTGKASIDNRYTYLSPAGNTVNTIGTTVPVFKNNVLIGAYVLYRHQSRFNSIMSEIIELQSIFSARDKSSYNGTHYTFEKILGNSAVITEAKEKAKRAALSDAPILLYGETGTGKELFAQSIHNASYHSGEPFVAVNCAAIPESLLESTLFGTIKGAFTGAQNSTGLFEAAKSGTIFLDEINSLPLQLQPKLLRAIQEKKVRKVGATNEIPIHCRIISSCNQPPLECIEKNALRPDLFYRLSTVTIDIPPLRLRKKDILELTYFFAKNFSGLNALPSDYLSEDVKSIFLNYSWPGNVRELQHIIESTLVLTNFEEGITVGSLPSYLTVQTVKNNLDSKWIDFAAPGSLKEQLCQFEKQAIEQALVENNFNLSKTAKQIGYTRSNLQYRLKILKIEF